jgi:Fe-S-cluster-containing dehydrogenase component
MAGNSKLTSETSMPRVEIPAELTTLDEVKGFIQKEITRRDFNKAMGVAGLGAVAFQVGCGSSATQTTSRQVYVANAKGMIVADSIYCVGCRRCEAACVGFNYGKTQPYISNVKVNRNLLYGVKDVSGGVRTDGLYGNFRIVQDTCRQCPHPVPCQLACPNAAIEVNEPLNARIVNEAKCVGCGICVEACPWEMTALDGPVNGATTKSHKCTLCSDSYAAATDKASWRPMCVEACVTGALRYVPWEDRTNDVPQRHVVPASIQLAPDVKDTCKQCH